jgi:hypothetical protein
MQLPFSIGSEEIAEVHAPGAITVLEPYGP